MKVLNNNRTKILVGVNIAILALTLGLGLRMLQTAATTDAPNGGGKPAGEAVVPEETGSTNSPAGDGTADSITAPVDVIVQEESPMTTVAVEDGTDNENPAPDPIPVEPPAEDTEPEPQPEREPVPQPDPEPEPAPSTVKLSPVTITRSSACVDGDTFCNTIFPTVFVTYTTPDGQSITLDNGTASQTVTVEGEPVTVFAGGEFPYAEGWKLSVFVRDDWRGRASNSNFEVSSLFHTRLEEAGGQAELTVGYRIDIN